MMFWLVTVCSLMSSTITLSEATRCMGSARYRLSFKGEWTRTSHPDDFPLVSGPHFSPVVGCSHKASYVMWQRGSIATPGVKLVAETGSTSDINKELDQQISSQTVLAKFQGSRIFNTGSTIVNDVPVNSEYPLVSAITMIAPSPDWFIGVHGYSLCNETTGKWIENRMEYLFPYDAGTDSAPRFADGDKPTNPQEPIFIITHTQEGSFKSNNLIKRFGTFTFLKTFDSNPDTSPMTTMEYQRPTSSMTTSIDMPPMSTAKTEVENPRTSAMTTSVDMPPMSTAKTEVENPSASAMTTSIDMPPMSTKTEVTNPGTSSKTTSIDMPPMSTKTEVTNPSTSAMTMTSVDMPPMSTKTEAPSPKAKSTKMSPNTEGNPKAIMANATSSIMSNSIIARTTMKPSSKTPSSGESSVGHFSVFVFLKLMILNLFFADIL